MLCRNNKLGYDFSMQIYRFTQEGAEIAKRSGLDEFAGKLGIDTIIGINCTALEQILGSGLLRPDWVDEDIREIFNSLPTDAEKLALLRGLSIDPKQDAWRRVIGKEEGTLFPVDKTTVHEAARAEDRLVLGGVAGYIFEQLKPELLQEERYKDFGFETISDARIFLGAYAASRYIQNREKASSNSHPSYEYSKDGLRHTVSVGGSLDGDFRLSSSSTPESSAIAPNFQRVEFCLENVETVGSYHSLEPLIAEAMLVDTLTRGGKEEARKLIDSFDEVVQSRTRGGVIEFTIGNFADYGDSASSSAPMELYFLKTEYTEEELKGKRDEPIFNLFVSPTAQKVSLEIRSTDEGIVLRNTHDDTPNTEGGITIFREHYVDLFSCLLSQTQRGLGRTSPLQLMEMLRIGREMLDCDGDYFASLV